MRLGAVNPPMNLANLQAEYHCALRQLSSFQMDVWTSPLQIQEWASVFGCESTATASKRLTELEQNKKARRPQSGGDFMVRLDCLSPQQQSMAESLFAARFNRIRNKNSLSSKK
jgi:hypothetical protein